MFFLNAAAAAADPAAQGSMMASPILMIVLMFGLMYFLMIRPENKKKKQLEEMRGSLKNGDEITTIGGIVGTVVNVKDDNIVIEVGADRVRLELTKWSVSTNNSAMREAEKAKVAAAAKRKAEKENKKK